MYFTHAPLPGGISARRKEGEITSPDTVPFPSHILLEAEKHTNAFFLVVHLEFSLRWSSAEFPLEYPNLYLVSNSEKKEISPRFGGAGLGATSFSSERSGCSYLGARREAKVD